MVSNINALGSIAEKQSQDLMLQVHSLQCKLYSRTAPHESDILRKKIVSLIC
jgi:hypothetical protein